MSTRRHHFALVILVAGLTTVAGCSTVALDLDGREFLSVGLSENGAPKTLVDGSRISLSFTETGVHANAGCNNLGGSYRIELGKLRYDATSMTAMGCGQLLETQDEWLSNFLDSDPMITLAGDDLQLTNGSASIRLLDREVAEPDLNLVGTIWRLEGLLTQHGQTQSSLPEGTSASIVFKADGSVEVQSGCNSGSGTWKLEGAGVRIENVALTKKACLRGPAELEAAVLAVIGSAGISADIESEVLTLMGGEKGLQLRGS